MFNAVDDPASVQRIPMAGLVSVQDRRARHHLLGDIDALSFVTGKRTSGYDPCAGARAKGLLMAELKRRNVGYRELAEKLTAAGSPETERNIANKISRGGFTAAFLLQCLHAIGVKEV